MHEIITLQLGQQSNYLATHFWNTQESYFTYSENDEPLIDHDVHFRPGLSPDGKTETYMPRTVIYDLKGAFGSMKKINALYEIEGEKPDPTQLDLNSTASGVCRPGKTVLQKADPIQPSPYTEALNSGLPPPRPTPDTVRYFSDFSRLYYHPRSVVQLNEFEVASTIQPFEQFSTGEELFRELDKEHDLLDRDLRYFAEEADFMQGFQVFMGVDDAWGGFGSRYLERIRDEYGAKIAIWTWGLESPLKTMPRDKRLLRLANESRSFAELYTHSSILVPLSLPSRLPPSLTNFDPTSPWHTTALISSAVESALLPSRLRGQKKETLNTIIETLDLTGKQKVAGLQFSINSSPISDFSEGIQLDIKLSSSAADQIDVYSIRNQNQRTPRVFSQLLTSRGFSPSETSGKEGEELDEKGRRIRKSSYEPISKTYATELAFPILDSFPEIFTVEKDEEEEKEGAEVKVKITTSLSTDSSVCTRLRKLKDTVIKSIGLEDREMLGNDLAEMAEEYHEGWSGGSDSGEDD
ncbi:mtDNA inheritance, partitioning of the mitochondrial organelle [Podospora pseudocomata]|uniref:MtDNA inheritance, partitioning of the mitochondrial organelle n=1 Tax=Podospora pseudocomata TaxID=2093779 RepID=A0ABR0G3Y2_9PEZI|nr:mtDNA inheritance, partitioning of the mitochondrial organelle [Podospora pseudocomata]